MRKPAKRTLLPPKPKKRRHKKEHAIVLPKFEVLADGAHAVTIPVHTRNFANLQTGHSRKAGIMASKERAEQRATVARYLFGIGIKFRGVTLVRLAPGNGLDVGGLWNALKAPQDEVAAHLGIDDGPASPASWRMEQEKSTVYGVRVELRAEREPSWHELRAEVARLQAALHALGTEPANAQGGQFSEVGT